MRRLNEKELDARISKFLFRKYAQFPELNEPTRDHTKSSWAETEAEATLKKQTVRWSLQLS